MKNMTEQVNWEEKYREADQKIKELEALIKYYEEQILLAKRRQFGASSEKTEGAFQLGLFDEAENTADPKAEEAGTEEITYKRKKTGKRSDDLSKLPVETVVHELPEEERVCPECNGALHKMSDDVRCEIEIIPARYVVKQHVQGIYACRSCEKNSDHVPIVKACGPKPVIKGSIASPSVVAHIMTEKYVKAVPLYRQEQGLLRDGISLSRQTMANWIIRCAEDWLNPIYSLMNEDLRKEEVIHADETVTQVLHEQGKKANTNSYMWLYRTSGCAKHPIVLYEYQPTRSSSHPKRFLSDWSGFLHTDGYQGYNQLPDVTVVGCFAHVRRKFDEALKILPAEQRGGTVAEQGLEYCNQLFGLEREYAELSAEERYEQRLKNSLPIAEAFLAWAKTFAGSPKSATKNALDYFINQWPRLKNIFLNGRLEISNNRAERSIKPFVIGRKNWLFSNTQRGAKSSAIIYSIIQTAIENGLNPFEYLKLLFEVLPNSSPSHISLFLPWASLVRDRCKV